MGRVSEMVSGGDFCDVCMYVLRKKRKKEKKEKETEEGGWVRLCLDL